MGQTKTLAQERFRTFFGFTSDFPLKLLIYFIGRSGTKAWRIGYVAKKSWTHWKSSAPCLCWQLLTAIRCIYSFSWWLVASAANRLIGEVVQSRRMPLLGPSPGWERLLPLSHLRHYAEWALTPRSLNVKLGPRRKGHKGRAVWLA